MNRSRIFSSSWIQRGDVSGGGGESIKGNPIWWIENWIKINLEMKSSSRKVIKYLHIALLIFLYFPSLIHASRQQSGHKCFLFCQNFSSCRPELYLKLLPSLLCLINYTSLITFYDLNTKRKKYFTTMDRRDALVCVW
jgi:hypothetical protein